jgi:hypothetical protein
MLGFRTLFHTAVAGLVLVSAAWEPSTGLVGAVTGCPFCDIGAGRTDQDLVVFETANVVVVATLAQRRANPGQVVVVPSGMGGATCSRMGVCATARTAWAASRITTTGPAPVRP